MKEIIERAEKLGYYTAINNQVFDEDVYEMAKEDLYYITLCLIQKRLREDKEIYVDVFRCLRDEEYCLAVNRNEFIYFNDYIEALEEGIKKALEILEKL